MCQLNQLITRLAQGKIPTTNFLHHRVTFLDLKGTLASLLTRQNSRAAASCRILLRRYFQKVSAIMSGGKHVFWLATINVQDLHKI